jgi:homoserine dehydrogenase
MRKKLKLGLFGFGCVGQGLYHVLHETHGGVQAEIKKICVKNKNKERILPEKFFTFDKHEILNDPEIDVVVELIDDATAAYEIVKTSLQKGKAVVTANKKMLAEHLEEIYHLQKKYNKPVIYEGAVCGSIPILRNLEEYYDNDLISSIDGIFNGSTNFILTKVFEEKKSYADALKTQPGCKRIRSQVQTGYCHCTYFRAFCKTGTGNQYRYQQHLRYRSEICSRKRIYHQTDRTCFQIKWKYLWIRCASVY